MYSAHTYTRKIAIRIAVLMALLAGLIAVKISVTREASSIATEIRMHKESTQIVRATRDESLALLSSFALVSGNEPRIRTALPSADYIVPFTDALDAAASRAAVNISSRFNNPNATEHILPPDINGVTATIYGIDMGIDIEGDARALEQFLRELEALPYYLTITSFTSSSNSESGWETAQRGRITATLYTQH
jgi:hypothetical protein